MAYVVGRHGTKVAYGHFAVSSKKFQPDLKKKRKWFGVVLNRVLGKEANLSLCSRQLPIGWKVVLLPNEPKFEVWPYANRNLVTAHEIVRNGSELVLAKVVRLDSRIRPIALCRIRIFHMCRWPDDFFGSFRQLAK